MGPPTLTDWGKWCLSDPSLGLSLDSSRGRVPPSPQEGGQHRLCDPYHLLVSFGTRLTGQPGNPGPVGLRGKGRRWIRCHACNDRVTEDVWELRFLFWRTGRYETEPNAKMDGKKPLGIEIPTRQGKDAAGGCGEKGHTDNTVDHKALTSQSTGPNMGAGSELTHIRDHKVVQR